jgi:2-polyprenyl-6-methoxyphenol hydroxylase-like FAD-dependent oxidoreductase
MENRNILISGASIAGPALALWLARYGFRAAIIERAPVVRPGGYAVDFRGASMDVLKRMGILGEVQRMQTRTGAITIVDGVGKRIADMPDGFTSGQLEIMRGDLAGVLHQATQQDVEYIFDDSIASLVEDEGGVRVTFNRSPPRTFDLVVGADGLHSKVRALAFGEESQFIHHLGYYISIFTIPDYMNLDSNGLFYGTAGKKVGIFGAKDDGKAMASFYFASPLLKRDRLNIAKQKNFLRTTFATEGWEVPQLLKMMDDAPDFYFDSISQIKMNRWSAGAQCIARRCSLLRFSSFGYGNGYGSGGSVHSCGRIEGGRRRLHHRLCPLRNPDARVRDEVPEDCRWC